MIKIGFELETDEGVEAPSSETVVQALSEALPKEWWATSRDDSWGVKALFALNDDGTMRQADARLRPVSYDRLEAYLAQERKLTTHLDGVIYEKGKTIDQHWDEIAGLEEQVKLLGLNKSAVAGTIQGQKKRIEFLVAENGHNEDLVNNLREKNDNQFNQLEDLKQQFVAAEHIIDGLREELFATDKKLKERTESLDVSQHEWKHRGKQLADMKDDMGDMAANLTHAEKHLTLKQEALNDANQEAQNHAMMIAKIVAAMQGAGYDISGWGNDEELTELEDHANVIRDEASSLSSKLDTIRTQR